MARTNGTERSGASKTRAGRRWVSPERTGREEEAVCQAPSCLCVCYFTGLSNSTRRSSSYPHFMDIQVLSWSHLPEVTATAGSRTWISDQTWVIPSPGVCLSRDGGGFMGSRRSRRGFSSCPLVPDPAIPSVMYDLLQQRFISRSCQLWKSATLIHQHA